MKILAIETSCDETAAATVKSNRGKIKILSNIVSSQNDLHRKYGGVYPELASRAHVENIIPAIKAALNAAKTKLEEIDLIAVTVGPGLIGSLLVGVETAKTLAYSLNKPIIGVNHWLGHIYSNWAFKPYPKFPALVLIVSGGHTGLVLMKSHSDLKTLGETLDDAAGEAFDKVAKLLQLGYPGGPAIAETAAEFPISNSQFSNKPQIPNIKFPRSMLGRDDFNFSFSGLKTSVLYLTKKLGPQKTKKYRSQIAAEFQQTVIDILIGKTIQAAEKFRPKSICLCGGVSANRELREQMAAKIKKEFPKTSFHVPPMPLTTDNAAMIGIAAAYHLDRKISWQNLNANSNLRL